MMCVSLFSYQGSLLFSSDSFDSLSCSKPFVKNFFHLFFAFRKLLFALSNDSFYTLSYQLSSVKNFFNFFQNQLIFKKWFLCDSQIIITPHILAVNCFLTYLQFIFMITVSKGILRVMLACKWRYTLLTRPHMSKKWGGGPMDCEWGQDCGSA